MNDKFLDYDLSTKLKPYLNKVKVLKGVYSEFFNGHLKTDNVITFHQTVKVIDKVNAIVRDIQKFKETQGVDFCTVVWSGSVEVDSDFGETLKTMEDLNVK